MNTYLPKKGDYKQVGNLTMDTITAGINHYKRFGKTVSKIRLSNSMWKSFIEYMKKIDLSYKPQDEFELDNIIISKGSILQLKRMEFELLEEKAEA